MNLRIRGMIIGLAVGALSGSVLEANHSVTIGIGLGLGTLLGFIVEKYRKARR